MDSRCTWQHCNQPIGFNSHDAGQQTPCPYCGQETILFVQQMPKVIAMSIENPMTPTSIDFDELGTGQKAGHSTISKEVLVGAFFLSFLIPFLGIFFGIWLITKNKLADGIACMGSAILGGWFWLQVFSG